MYLISFMKLKHFNQMIWLNVFNFFFHSLHKIISMILFSEWLTPQEKAATGWRKTIEIDWWNDWIWCHVWHHNSFFCFINALLIQIGYAIWIHALLLFAAAAAWFNSFNEWIKFKQRLSQHSIKQFIVWFTAGGLWAVAHDSFDSFMALLCFAEHAVHHVFHWINLFITIIASEWWLIEWAINSMDGVIREDKIKINLFIFNLA